MLSLNDLCVSASVCACWRLTLILHHRLGLLGRNLHLNNAVLIRNEGHGRARGLRKYMPCCGREEERPDQDVSQYEKMVRRPLKHLHGTVAGLLHSNELDTASQNIMANKKKFSPLLNPGEVFALQRWVYEIMLTRHAADSCLRGAHMTSRGTR